MKKADRENHVECMPEESHGPFLNCAQDCELGKSATNILCKAKHQRVNKHSRILIAWGCCASADTNRVSVSCVIQLKAVHSAVHVERASPAIDEVFGMWAGSRIFLQVETTIQ